MRSAFVMTIVLATLAGCRSPGLPPEPPEQDATNPDVGLVEARPRANPFTRSAFEGVKLDGGGGHEHHHHGHGAKQAPAAAEGAEAPGKAEEPAKGSHESHEQAGHGGGS